MPIDSGPTQLLPFSQNFDNGYVAYRHPEFVRVFHDQMVQLKLSKGDGLFFNPALFHAAGENRTKDFNRSANLLQISACWGKPMENVDRSKVMRLIWPCLRDGLQKELGTKRVQALFRAVADGYSFPTNLDTDPPPAGGVSQPPLQDIRAGQVLTDLSSTVLRLSLIWFSGVHKRDGTTILCVANWRRWNRSDYLDLDSGVFSFHRRWLPPRRVCL